MKLYAIGVMLAGAAMPGGVAVVHAQNAPASATGGADSVIRSETRVVLVDAVAVDKKGKFARDLAQKDFRIWEDGKEQKITSFSLESSGASPDRSSKHFIAMFFDASSTGQVARQEGSRFADGFASPDRYMAVINYNGDGGAHIAQEFTTDPALLKKSLGEIPAAAGPASAYPDMLASIRNIARSLGLIRGRKAVILFSNRAGTDADLSRDVALTIDACNQANVAVYSVGGRGLIGTLTGPGENGASGLIARLGNAVGRLYTPDSPAPVLGFQRTPTQVGPPVAGNNSTSVDHATAGTAGATDKNVLRALAEGTGGLALTTSNDIAGALGTIAREQDEYYLLGYTPAVDSAEGTCHDLRVKVDRGDLEVRTRKSYCTSKPVDPLAGKTVGQALEARAVGGTAGGNAAKMQLPWFYSGANVARVSLAMDIVPSTMKFQKEKGKLHGELDVAGVASKPDGTVAARFSDLVKLDFDTQQEADAFLKAPYHYVDQFQIAPGQYMVGVAFSTDGSGAQGFGKAEMPLTVEPWNGQVLSMSGLALSRESRAAADLVAGLDAALLEGPRPLISKGIEVVPAGTSQFHAGERGFIYFEVYEPALAKLGADAGAVATLPAESIRIRILDRATGKPRADSGLLAATRWMRPGNPVVPVAQTLGTDSLPAGSYKVEVSVTPVAGSPVVRTADFDVE